MATVAADGRVGGLPPAVRELLDAPNYVHLSTLRRDGTPRNWVVWVGLEGDRVLVCTTDFSWKAKDEVEKARHTRLGFVHAPASGAS